jgi:ABC-type amino acid transport substrate-binding protein
MTAPGGLRLSRRRALRGLAALMAGHVAPAAVPLHIHMAGNGSFPPFTFTGDSGQMVGLLVDALDLIGAKTGIVFDFADIPWPRGQQWVQSGKLDGFCTTNTAERRQYVTFASTPVYEERAVLVHRAGELSGAPRSIEDLKGLKIGAPRGSGWAKEVLAGYDVLWVPDVTNLLAMIAARRIDVSVGGEAETVAAIAAYPGAKALQISTLPAVYGGGFCIGLRKSFPDVGAVVARLEDAIRAVKESGELQSVVSRYLQRSRD